MSRNRSWYICTLNYLPGTPLVMVVFYNKLLRESKDLRFNGEIPWGSALNIYTES